MPSGDRYEYCVFSKHLSWLSVDELGEALEEIGFDGADLAVRPGGHVEPEHVTSDLPVAVETLAKRGISCPMIVTNITEPSEQAEQVIKAAAEAGVRYYRMGYLHYGESIHASLEEHRRRFHRLADLNERYGIHGAYQNHMGTWVGSPVWDLHDLLSGLNTKAIGCQYDVRHAAIEGGRSWPLGMRALAERIRCIVVKDGTWRTREDGSVGPVSVPVGSGMVDWELFRLILSHSAFEGTLSVHYEFPLFSEDPEALEPAERTEKTIVAMREELERVKKLLEA
ncbi:MAG: sugar phosphate isomerase/epimerase family protein [Spirochaetota bacterium]